MRIDRLHVEEHVYKTPEDAPAAPVEVCGLPAVIPTTVKGENSEGDAIDEEEFETIEFDDDDMKECLGLMERSMHMCDELLDNERVILTERLRTAIRDMRLDLYATLRNFLDMDKSDEARAQQHYFEGMTDATNEIVARYKRDRED